MAALSLRKSLRGCQLTEEARRLSEQYINDRSDIYLANYSTNPARLYLISGIVLLLNTAMRDIAHPKYCSRVLCGALQLLDGRGLDAYVLDAPFSCALGESYKVLRGRHADYLDACAATLSKPRSEQERKDLAAAISSCTCFTHRPRETESMLMLLRSLHGFEVARQFTLQDFLHGLVRHLSGVLSDAVSTETIRGMTATGGLPRIYKPKRSRRPLWPTDPGQLMPHGLEQSTEGYAMSFDACRNDRTQETLIVVSNLLAICGRSCLPYLLRLFPALPRRTLILVEDIYRESQNNRGEIEPRMELSWYQSLWAIGTFCLHLSDITICRPSDIHGFVSVAVVDLDSATNDATPCGFLSVCNTVLMVLPTLRHNLRIFTDERIAELHRTFVRVGITFNEYKSPLLRENAHPAITQAKEDMLSLPDDPIQSALGSFLLVARAQYCFSPECQQTFVDAGRPFARCAGCEVLRYCSRECQRQAWKHPTLPHKSVCAKLRALRGRAGLMRDQNWGSADGPGRRVFADACSADEELAAFADECGRHLAVLTAERLQNLDGPSIKESEELEGKGLDRVVDWGTIRVLDSADWHASR